jgi:hypothetical protein
VERDLRFAAKSSILPMMSTVKEIETAIARLAVEDMEAIRDWLDELIEDQLEVSDEFKAKLQRAKREVAAGIHSRIRQPETRK